MKKGRRMARDAVVQILYQMDLGDTESISVTEALERFESHFSFDPEERAFVLRLVSGVRATLPELDDKISQFSEHWRIERMAAIDRNILRLGVYELIYAKDIPVTVTLNEMVELAKQFGSEESSAFVNGVLDKLKNSIDLSGKAP